MAKRGRKKKTKFNIDIAVVALIIISVILGILIYTNAGFIGETISPALGGILGFTKYIIPIATFMMGIYLACDKGKKYITTKIILYLLFLVSLSTTLATFYIAPTGTTNMQIALNNAYKAGMQNIGGGIVGTVIAVPLLNMIGAATYILSIGTGLISIIFIFKIKPAKAISNIVNNIEEKRERREIRREKELIKQKEINKKEELKKESAKERKLREKEEAKKKALEVNEEQLLAGLEEEIKTGKLKKYKHGEDDIMPLTMEDKKQLNPNELGNLFKEVAEEKKENTKQELNLEHTMTMEDEKETYEFPPIEMLSMGSKASIKGGKKTVTDTATKLQKTLYSFGVSAKVENVSVGPAITRYELRPAEGVRVSKIANLADDIALNLAAETIRIEAPIPGKNAVGIEVPNAENEIVNLRDIISTSEFKNHKSKLAFALGKDVAGQEIVTDIAKMPHVLIAGATGSGKSVCINTLITSIVYKAKPSEVKLVMVDPKMVELSVYNGIPHLLIPVVTDPKKAAGALAWAVQEMENRYKTFAAKGVRDLKGYNEAVKNSSESGTLPHIVVIIDELADLMMVARKDVEDAICRLAQKARAAGMHLVIATQRPSVDVITGLIKANIPSRIAFAVSSQVDSRTILDMIGAEKLLGKGDMLFYPTGAPKPTRIQGAFISDKEVESIVNFLKKDGEAKYNEDIIESIENSNKTEQELELEQKEDDDADPFLMDAIEVVIDSRQASTSFIQRRFKVGYARAGRIIDQMEERGVISGYQGSKPREVLMSKERWAELKMGAEPTNINIENNVVEEDTEE